MTRIDKRLRIESILSHPFEQNSYVLWLEGGAEALVVDPGFDPVSILEVLGGNGLSLSGQLLTHGHADHIAGIATIRQAFPDAPIIIGRNEAHLLSDPNENLSAKYGFPITAPMADRLVDDGQRLEIAGLSLLIREIPGHSPGSVAYILDQFNPWVVFGGDVLFSGSIGRTDLGGSFETLARGIRTKLFILPDDAVVFSGHGPETTLGEEKRNNPFVGEASSYVPE